MSGLISFKGLRIPGIMGAPMVLSTFTIMLSAGISEIQTEPRGHQGQEHTWQLIMT